MKTLKFNPKLPLERIEISRLNVRHTKTREGLDELAKSIASIGVQQPIVVVKKKGEKDKFELIIGQRRYLACKQLNLNAIPALITTIKNETEALILSFSENIQRVELGYEDKMQVATELLAVLKSVDKVATAIGVTPNTVRNYLGYSAVSEHIKDMVNANKLAPTTALLITRYIPDEKKAIRIAEKIKEVHSDKKRRLILDIAKENPNKTISEIAKLASKKYDTITIYLTPTLAQGLKRASQDFSVGREDIVIEATEEWLDNRNFIK